MSLLFPAPDADCQLIPLNKHVVSFSNEHRFPDGGSVVLDELLLNKLICNLEALSEAGGLYNFMRNYQVPEITVVLYIDKDIKSRSRKRPPTIKRKTLMLYNMKRIVTVLMLLLLLLIYPNISSAQDAAFYFQQGQALFDKGNYAEAIKAYTNAIELNPNHGEAYRRRGVCKATLKSYEAAIPDYTKAIEINPKNSKAYNGRGTAKHRGLKDYAGAMSDFNKAIELDPAYSSAYYSRGILKIDMKDFMGAGNDCEASIATNRKYSPGYICLGVINYEFKDFHNAIQIFTKAIELDPKSDFAYYNRAQSYKGAGDAANAAKDFQKTLEINPRRKDAQEELRQLAFMQLQPATPKEYPKLPEQKPAQPIQPQPVKGEMKPLSDAVPLEPQAAAGY